METTMDAGTAEQHSEVQLRYRKLIENLPGCIVFVVDRDLRVTYAGGGLITHSGFRPQAYLGRLAREFTPPSMFAAAEPYVLATLRGEQTSFDLDYPAGPSFEFRMAPLEAGKDPPTEILVIALDTTERKRAEAAKREAQLVLQQAVQAANIGLWDVDLLSQRVHYSHEWKQQLGCEDDEIGDSLDEWVRRLHPDDRERASALGIAYLAAPGPGYEQEFRLQHKNGSYRWILARGTVYFDADGKPARALGVHIDITEKKLAEWALRESEGEQRELAKSLAAERDRLVNVLESLPVGVWISAPDGQVVAKNRQADVIWRGDAPLPAGVEAYTEYAAWDTVTGEPLAPADYPVARALHTGAPSGPRELHIRRFDGSEGTVLVSAVPLRGRQGQAAGVVGINVDITERKLRELENEQLLRQVQSTAGQLAHVVNSAPDAVLLLDSLGGVLLTNSNADTVLRQQAVYDEHGRLRQLAGMQWEELQAAPPGEWHTLRAGQQVFEVVASPVSTEEAASWVVGVRDVTIERAIREQLQRQEQLAAVGQLAAGIAHDFNNIMSVISVYAEMTSEVPGLTANERARTLTIVEQTQRAARMIRQILDFSRRSVYERQVLDLLPLLKEEAKLLRQTLPESIEIKLDYVPGEYLVRGDPTRIQQLVMNLALNARDAMPNGGTLHVGLGRTVVEAGRRAPLAEMGAGHWVKITVRDTGAGIRPEHLAHIFEPFFTTKEPGKGTGLGLAQVQGIVAQHEGQITVASEPGTGTTFTIYLPAVAIPAGATPEGVERAERLPQGHGECVLLVEDNGEVRSSLVTLLEALNYRVVEAGNGQEALACLMQPRQRVDVILCDVVMPRLGGVGLVKALRKEGVKTPVILISGYAAGEARTELREAGVTAWLDKPPSSAALAGALAAAVVRG